MSDYKKTKKGSGKKIDTDKSKLKGPSCHAASCKFQYMKLLTSHDTDEVISKLEALKRTKSK